MLAVVATTTALDAFGSPDRAFLTVVAATLVVTGLTGVAFFALGTLRLGNLIPVRAAPGGRRVPRGNRVAAPEGRAVDALLD